MADNVRIIEYFYAQVGDTPGTGRRLLEHLSERGVNLLAFTAFPIDSGQSQLDFVPESASQLRKAAADAGIALFGPKRAFLFQGDDRIGALHEHHLVLANAGVNVLAANGTVDGTGRYGFILWVPQEQFDQASAALGL